ncbi:uncharacterized protein DS421_12g371800 [Arachis hypogaea]|nr:uncharacterized protein DS421_12g371800 [Arachis hypogaea]
MEGLEDARRKEKKKRSAGRARVSVGHVGGLEEFVEHVDRPLGVWLGRLTCLLGCFGFISYGTLLFL